LKIFHLHTYQNDNTDNLTESSTYKSAGAQYFSKHVGIVMSTHLEATP
jgi:hypothetical protein